MPVSSTVGNADRQIAMGITFSKPEIFFFFFLPLPVNKYNLIELEKLRVARGPGLCAVEGCGQLRKCRQLPLGLVIPRSFELWQIRFDPYDVYYLVP